MVIKNIHDNEIKLLYYNKWNYIQENKLENKNNYIKKHHISTLHNG